MFIHLTDPADHSRIVLNASCILMLRPSAQGGSTIYLTTGATHHPDMLRARETPEDILGLINAGSAANANGGPVASAETGAGAFEPGPVETARPAH